MDELINVGKILIKASELEILKKYNIDIVNCNSIEEVLFLIDNFLNDAYDLYDEEYDELDYVASSLMERKYYMETNK